MKLLQNVCRAAGVLAGSPPWIMADRKRIEGSTRVEHDLLANGLSHRLEVIGKAESHRSEGLP